MKILSILFVAVVFMSVVGFSTEVAAQTKNPPSKKDQNATKAKEHFKAGQALFGAGQFEKAADEFIKAYEYKALPAFLFNIAVCYEKSEQYVKAKEYFVEYLAKEPNTKDLQAIQARIRLLDRLIEYKENQRKLQEPNKDQPTDQPTDKPADTPTDQPTDKPADTPTDQPTDKPILEKPELPPIQTRMLTSISSDPPGAKLYLDNKQNFLGTTPFEGEVPPGKHIIILEMKGFADMKREIRVQEDRMLDIVVPMMKQDLSMGWLQITSNVPGARVYVDKKEIGHVGVTPYAAMIKPGKHTIWLVHEDYREEMTKIQVKAGVTNEIYVEMQRQPVGTITILGRNVQDARVKIDGKTICVAPCARVKVPAGRHRISVHKKNRKSASKKIHVNVGEQKMFDVTLQKAPSRSGAVSGYILGIASLAGAMWAGGKSENLQKEIQDDLDAGIPVFSNDKRIRDGKIYAIGANVLYGISALSLTVALYRTFIDTTPDSHIRERSSPPDGAAVQWEPLLIPGGAGVNVTLHY